MSEYMTEQEVKDAPVGTKVDVAVGGHTDFYAIKGVDKWYFYNSTTSIDAGSVNNSETDMMVHYYKAKKRDVKPSWSDVKEGDTVKVTIEGVVLSEPITDNGYYTIDVNNSTAYVKRTSATLESVTKYDPMAKYKSGDKVRFKYQNLTSDWVEVEINSSGNPMVQFHPNVTPVALDNKFIEILEHKPLL